MINPAPDFLSFSLEELLEMLPQNRPLYRDSGLWQVRTDNMETIFLQQRANDGLKKFLADYLTIMWPIDETFREEFPYLVVHQ